MRRQNTNSNKVIRRYDPEKIPNPIVQELNQYDKSIAIKILTKINVKNNKTDAMIAIIEKAVVAAAFSILDKR